MSVSEAQAVEASDASVRVVDVDSHVAEPLDLWTSRISPKWGDQIPAPVWDEAGGEYRWRVGESLLSGIGEYCTAGWHEPFPSHPPTLEEADPACYTPAARLRRLDDWGLAAQVLYPNIIGFDTHAFIEQLDPALALECVRAYNDFLAEFASADPNRLIPIMMLPVWDPQACVVEMKRARELGHRGILFAALFERIGLPGITDPIWEPVLSAAQDFDLSVNFHVGFSVRTSLKSKSGWQMRTRNALAERTDRLSFVKRVTLGCTSNIEAAAHVVLQGVPAKYPRLKFVSVESGFGYWPWVLEQMDWLWQSSGAYREFPDRDLPSEVWRRSFLATFWFEQYPLVQLENFADNVMFETDFPHETSLPALGVNAAAHATESLRAAGVSSETTSKVLYGNAARLYGIH